MLYAFITDNQALFPEFLNFVCDLTNSVNKDIRISVFGLFEQMSEDALLRRFFVNTENLHALLDCIISDSQNENCEISLNALKTLAKLVKCNKTGVYIPGQTLEAEKQRIRIMQHGFLQILAYLVLQTKDANLKKTADDFLRFSCEIKELEWSIKALDKYVHNRILFSRNKSKSKEPNYVTENNKQQQNLPEINVANNTKNMTEPNTECNPTPTAEIPMMIYTHANFENTVLKQIQKIEQVSYSSNLAILKQKFGMTQQFDMWQGKDLILLEYFFFLFLIY